jgi:gluconolactonase
MIRLTLLALAAVPLLHAQDTSLKDWLIEGEPWKVAVQGFEFIDGLACDAAGHLLFTDVKSGKGIYQLEPATGKHELIVDNLPGISGLHVGPGGLFYACQNKAQRVITVTRDGKVEELLANVKCNDLIVTSKGFVYITETPTKRIHLITPDKQHRVVDEGSVKRPNGLTISPDERTLAVSDHGGLNVWTWAIADDGSLSAAAPYMTMESPLSEDQSGGPKTDKRPDLPAFKPEALGDGMTTESLGRWFVTSAMGVQVFDTAGRHSGTLAKPTPDSKVVSVEFAGAQHDQLYIAAGDKIWSRKLKVTGLFR